MIVTIANDCVGEMGAKHTVLNEEQAAFADWINDNLKNDKDVEHKLELSVIATTTEHDNTDDTTAQDTGSDLYEKMDDGILLCKMVNMAAPDTIDERVINTGRNISIFKVRGSTMVRVVMILFLSSNMRTSPWR